MLGMAGFAVRIDDLRAAAAAFARLRNDAEGLLATSGFGDTAGMAGRDQVLAPWRARYDAMAAAEWAAATAAVATLGAIATKLAGTADIYLGAEREATNGLSTPPKGAAGLTGGAASGAELGRSGGVGPASGAGPGRSGGVGPASGGGPGRSGGVWPPSGAGPGRSGGVGPPSSTGPGGPEVPDALAAYYPGGDPERLRAAAARWAALAEGMSRAAGTGDDTFRRLAANGDGVAFSAMRTFWAQRYTPCATDPLFNAVVNGAGLLADSCRELADLIELTRTAVRGVAAEAVADMEPLELPARLLGKIAWNVPELELLVGMGALTLAYLNHYRDAYVSSLDRLVERLGPAEEQRLLTAAAMADVGLADVGQVARLGLSGTAWDTAAGPHPTPDAIHLVPQQATHILRGDRSGGGHAPGAGVPGKTEFPRGWTDDAIVAAALSVARDPETVERSRMSGRWEAVGVRAGVRIRAVVADDGFLVTAVPLDGPGVVRNPH